MTAETITTQMPELPQAARLHMARYLAGLEMQELSRRTGISRNTIAHYEKLDYDKRRTPAYIRLWAMATGFPYEWLADGVTTSGDGLSVNHRGNFHQRASASNVYDATDRFRRGPGHGLRRTGTD